MEKRFSQSAVASASDGSVNSALRKLGFACDAADIVLTYWPDKELSPSPFVPPRMKRPSPGLVLKNRMQTMRMRCRTIWTRRRRFGDMRLRSMVSGVGYPARHLVELLGSIGW